MCLCVCVCVCVRAGLRTSVKYKMGCIFAWHSSRCSYRIPCRCRRHATLIEYLTSTSFVHLGPSPSGTKNIYIYMYILDILLTRTCIYVTNTIRNSVFEPHHPRSYPDSPSPPPLSHTYVVCVYIYMYTHALFSVCLCCVSRSDTRRR